MATFIAARIMDKRKISLQAGQDHYRAYFIRTNLYEKWRAETEAILIQEGCGDCIVTA